MLSSLLGLAALAVPLSTEVDVSPAVRAVILQNKQGGPEAERALEKLLSGGDRSAAVLLAELLMQPGRRGGPDPARACGFAEAAGEHPEALHNLAACYDNGLGRPRDKARARELYVKASELGFAKSACALGNLLISGQGGPADAARGTDLCRRAADAGDADAQTDYGGSLLIGRNVRKDAVEARRYLALAAARKHANAAFLLGQIYWNGDGVAKDKAEAARWWRVAHDAGRPDAARLLALEVLGRLVAVHTAKKPVPASVMDEVRGWLAIAAEKDPDPARRREMAGLLSELAGLAPAD